MYALKLLIGLLSTLALVAAEPIPSPSDTVPPVGDRGGLAIEATGTPANEAKPNPPAAPPQDGNYPAIRLHIPAFALVEKKTKGAYVGPASTTWKSFGQTITALQFDKLYKSDPFTRADLTVTTYQHDNDWEMIRADQLDETKKKKLPLPKEAAKHQVSNSTSSRATLMSSSAQSTQTSGRGPRKSRLMFWRLPHGSVLPKAPSLSLMVSS
jgi:hypothetical protein